MKLIKTYLFFIFILIISPHIFSMEQTSEKSYLEQIYEYMGWKPESKEEQKEISKELTFGQALARLNSFLKEEIEYITSKIAPGIKITPEEFVVIEWLSTEEAMEKFESLIRTINEKISEGTPEELKESLSIIKQAVIALNNTRESLSYVQSLIAECDVELYPTIDKSFSHLDQFHINCLTIYEMLGLKSKERDEYTVDDIIKKADERNKELDPTTEESKKIRQIKFTIGNKIGKKIYDAWLSDKEKNITKDGHLSMLRIDPKELNLGEVLNLNNRLLQEKIELEQLQKTIEKII